MALFGVILALSALCALQNGGSVAAAAAAAEPSKDWWKTAVFYQIYPSSFKDSNNDGLGDLKGIIEKIDHFKDAGVDAVWLSPIFDSPQVDQGYDISDYYKIYDKFGTEDDLKELVKQAHDQGIKVILDFVPNHTSDKNQWFIDSEQDKPGFEDFYVWADAKYADDDTEKTTPLPPNNWVSVFKGSAWTWSGTKGKFYLHQFTSAQPDLNYNSKAVQDEMKNVMTYWLDRGVDGFRIDAVPYLFEDVTQLPDEPKSNIEGVNADEYDSLVHIYTKDLMQSFDLMYDWRRHVDDYTKTNNKDQIVLMSEAYADLGKTMLWYGTSDGGALGAHFTFNFFIIEEAGTEFTADTIATTVNKWLDNMPGIYTANWVLGNHDNHRVATRYGADNVDGFNMLMAILPGIGVTYNGEEIGMEDGKVTFEQGQDPVTKNDKDNFDKLSRDFERTPYQWDDTTNAGFNAGHETWLPVSDKYEDTNLKAQKAAATSHFKVYQSMMQLRKSSDILKKGRAEVKALQNVDVSSSSLQSNVVMVRRVLDKDEVLLFFNVGDKKTDLKLEKNLIAKGNKVLVVSSGSTTKIGAAVDVSKLTLQPHEAIMLQSKVPDQTSSGSIQHALPILVAALVYYICRFV